MDDILASIQPRRGIHENKIVLDLIIILTNLVRKYNRTILHPGFGIGHFIQSVSKVSLNIELTELNKFVLPKFIEVFELINTYEEFNMALKACHPEDFIKAFNYYKTEGDFKIQFELRDYTEDWESVIIHDYYALVISSSS